MRRTRLLGLCGTALLVSPGLVSAQDGQRPFIGADLGVYFPTSSTLRRAVGNSWLSFGAGTIRNQSLRGQEWDGDWNVISGEKGGNRVFLVSATYGITRPLSTDARNGQPYFSVRAGLAYLDYGIGAGAGRVSGRRLGWNANAELGMNIGERINVNVRYDVFSRADALTFDGLSVGVRFGLFRF